MPQAKLVVRDLNFKALEECAEMSDIILVEGGRKQLGSITKVEAKFKTPSQLFDFGVLYSETTRTQKSTTKIPG